MRVLIRLSLTAFLIWRVALGDRWALVVILCLSALVHEGQNVLLRRLREATASDILIRKRMLGGTKNER